LSANTFYRRVREYEATHGIAKPVSAWQRSQTKVNAPQSRPSLRSEKLTAWKEKAWEMLVWTNLRSLSAIQFQKGMPSLWRAP